MGGLFYMNYSYWSTYHEWSTIMGSLKDAECKVKDASSPEKADGWPTPMGWPLGRSWVNVVCWVDLQYKDSSGEWKDFANNKFHGDGVQGDAVRLMYSPGQTFVGPNPLTSFCKPEVKR